MPLPLYESSPSIQSPARALGIFAMNYTKLLIIGVIGLLFGAAVSVPTAGLEMRKSAFEALDDAVLRERVLAIEGPVKPVYTAEVRRMIGAYVTTGYRETERMLGRAALYFPTFEHYLYANDLPQALKYLPIVESRLRPRAVSSAGATGLWQLMRGTAADLGLRMDYYVDERRDPERATEAALEYLSYLYRRFDSWELALAAYNCGGGTVSKAIRRAGGTRDFWAIRQFLPRETQVYLSRYIAASYVAENYYRHDLFPHYPAPETQLTRTTQVYSQLSFRRIESITDTPLALLKQLNPTYRRSLIPRSQQGFTLRLPEAAMERLKVYRWETVDHQIVCDLAEASPVPTAPAPTGQFKSTYTVQSGDHLPGLAKLLELKEADILEWNGLTDNTLRPGQELILFFPLSVLSEE